MNLLRIICISTVVFLGIATPVRSKLHIPQGNIDQADSLFKAGHFTEAEKLYADALSADPKNFQAAVRLGSIALLTNRLDDAEEWLTKAIELKPEEHGPQSMLAEVFYRRDEFQRAVPLLRNIGKEAKASQLESFKDAVPWQIESQVEATSLKFVMTDPLPVVQVRVNGKETVNFFIDTGGAEVIIDAEFSKEIGAAQFGSEKGTFAGGKQAGFQFGRIDSLTLGDFTIKNMPVHIMDVRRFSSPIFMGKRVDGIIGTVLLYHFLTTVDYPEGELILRQKTAAGLRSFEQDAREKNFIVVPFWMAGDHYMVARGSVNKSQPMLFFVDTGLAGGGFTAPESTLKEAGIKLEQSLAGEGVGGGGKVKVIPFVAEELTFGEARAQNIRGLFTGPFPLEYAFGFRIGGLISHGFFRPYALTFDFNGMRLFLKGKQ